MSAFRLGAPAVALALAVLLALPSIRPAVAQPADAAPERSRTLGSVVKAGDVLDLPVRRPAGRKVGEVADLVLDLETGLFTHVMIERDAGGYLALPIREFALEREDPDVNRFHVLLTREGWRSTIRFTAEEWEDSDRRELADRKLRPEGDRGALVRFSEVTDLDLLGAEGEERGGITDVAFFTRNGRVHHVVAEEGGFFGIGETTHEVAWSPPHLDAEGGALHMALRHPDAADVPPPPVPLTLRPYTVHEYRVRSSGGEATVAGWESSGDPAEIPRPVITEFAPCDATYEIRVRSPKGERFRLHLIVHPVEGDPVLYRAEADAAGAIRYLEAAGAEQDPDAAELECVRAHLALILGGERPAAVVAPEAERREATYRATDGLLKSLTIAPPAADAPPTLSIDRK